MVRYATFALGFAAGWLARGTADSSRSAATTILAGAISAAGRIRRAIAIEKDHLEDLVAEARARADAMTGQHPARRTSREGASVDEAVA